MTAPQKYRKLPVEIEAAQWNGPESHEVHDWMRANGHPTEYDTKGEMYACKDAVFAATYEAVSE